MGKRGIIFGAANGLGRAIALELAKNKVDLVSVDKDFKNLESLDDKLQEYEVSNTIVHLDVEDTPKIFELANKVYERFGSIDYLISCAAILGELAPLAHFNTKLWNRVININLNANAHIIKAFTPLLLASDDPATAIFTTCSIAKENKAYWGAYSASKAGLENMVKLYAKEQSSDKIKVALFDPKEMDTRIRDQAMPTEDKTKITSAEKVASFFMKNLTNNSFKHGDILQYLG
ncbi:MAG: SDR family oxidoreductase [Rickettsiales bacterium]